MIEVRGVSHAFGQRVVLEDVSLSVAAGTVVGLVGPNGAGKTTLMRAIATLLRPDKGTIEVAGDDAQRRGTRVRRSVGYLPERATAYGDLLAWEYLDLFGEIAGLGRDDRRRRIDEALLAAGLSDRRDELIGKLSKGLKQRLALQSVLLHRPRALVFDEPTDGLDPASRDQVCQQIRALAQAGCAVLVSSHVLEELERVADRTVALVQNRLVALNAPTRMSWVLRLRGELPVGRLVAMGVPSVVAADIAGDALVLTLAEGAMDASEVTAALVQAGLAVVSIAQQTTPLLELYQRAIEEGGP